MSEMKVKVVLMRHGTALGNAGDTVEVTEAVAKALCAERESHDGCKVVKYRAARLASEKIQEIEPECCTAAEMAAAGKRNVVVTPPDTIEPKRLQVSKAEKAEKPEGKKGK
jgi:hypothetical protein